MFVQMTAETQTEMEHKESRDMTLIWGDCLEKMIPNMNFQWLEESIFLFVVFGEAILAQEPFCDFTCTSVYLIYLFNSNECLLHCS